MKLSNLFAKLTFVKSNVVRAAAAVALAGAVLTVATPAAEAQRGVVVRFAGPRYFRPAPPVRFYGGPVFYPEYEHRDWRVRHDFDRDHDGNRGFRR
jgi:hypothetical protein